MDELAIPMRLFVARCAGGSAVASTFDVPVVPKTQTVTVFVHNDVEYTKGFLLAALEGRGPSYRLAASREDPALALQIDEYEEIIWYLVLQGKLVANSYCVRKGLIRKGNFAAHIAKVLSKRPNPVLERCIPKTFNISTWEAYQSSGGSGWSPCDTASALVSCLAEVEEVFESHPGKHWILKPSLANKGAEVTVVAGLDAVVGMVKTWRDVREWVLQEYIERPLLIAKRKFHLRCYVLCVGSLKVFVYREALVLIAMHQYDLTDPEDSFSHLTNTCVSIQHDDFKESNYVRRLSDLPRLFAKQGTPNPAEAAASIYSQIREALAHTLHSFKGQFSSFMPLPNAFELFGVDFLVDEDLNVYLLEFNSGPDLKMTGSRLDYIISDMLRGSVDIALHGGNFPSIDPSCRSHAQAPAASAAAPPTAEAVVQPDLHPGASHGWDMVYSDVWATGGPSVAFQ